MKQMLKSKLEDVPEAERERVLGMIDKNPELFEKIALGVQSKMKEGKDQMSAIMEVVKTYQNDLSKLA